MIVACVSRVTVLNSSSELELVPTAGPNGSMIAVAHTDSGVVLIDLGWLGAEGALRAALARSNSDSSDVVAVFLTHAHRDHIAAWPVVRHARFYLADREVPLLEGTAQYRAWVVRTADQLVAPARPARGALDLRPFARDTVLAFGRDTLRAFLLPGHTPGSAAYLFRGTLFAGDAVARRLIRGPGAASRIYSDDVLEARRTLADLLVRARDYGVDRVCTAHAQCLPFSSERIQTLMQQ
jgi:glyoxylase-like metal-dependent hydrolase (beta-lactamase superfamily II)